MTTGKGERGFTLVEILIVVVLLGIMASVAVSSFGNATGTFKIDEAAREIQVAFQYARHQSIGGDVQANQKFGLWFMLPQGGGGNGNWFSYVQGNGTSTPDIKIHPVEKKPYTVDFDLSGYFQGVTLSVLNLNANNQLYFDKQGTPSIGGSVTIQYSGEQRTITVVKPSGVVTVS